MVWRMLAAGTQKQILIVDRDVAAAEPLRRQLQDAGFVACVITDAAAALTSVRERPPHLIIIDWSAPGSAPLELIDWARSARRRHGIRLIILSALSSEEQVVMGLNRGADDYITKPYSLREAVARVCVVLRRSPQVISQPALECDELVLDVAGSRVTAQGNSMNLRGVEYRLLEFLMSHSGKTFNRTQLLTLVWGGESEVDERTVDVNVQRLRKILSEWGCQSYIQTVRGLGYRFAPPGAVPLQ
jgi:two-component system, OmpR family, phosphate regulon response regulator PhoB